MNNNKPDLSKLTNSIIVQRVVLPLILSLILYLSLSVTELAVLIFPVIPVIYGWKTRNAIGSAIIGILPVFCLFLDLHLANLQNYAPERFRYVVTYFGELIAVGGVEGYLAARLPPIYLFIPVIFAFLWYIVFLSGIN